MLVGRDVCCIKGPVLLAQAARELNEHLGRHIAGMSASRSEVVQVPDGIGIGSAAADQRGAVVAWARSGAVFEKRLGKYNRWRYCNGGGNVITVVNAVTLNANNTGGSNKSRGNSNAKVNEHNNSNDMARKGNYQDIFFVVKIYSFVLRGRSVKCYRRDCHF